MLSVFIVGSVVGLGTYCGDYWAVVREEFPCASVVYDVGGNKGYSAVRLFSLYRPDYGLNGRTWWASRGLYWNARQGKMFNLSGSKGTSNFGCGMCSECLVGSVSEPFTRSSLDCGSGFRVYSFDGQRDLEHMVGIKVRVFREAQRAWRYSTLLFSNESGFQVWYPQGAGWEQASLKKASTRVENRDAFGVVNVTTVDEYAIWSRVGCPDILKVDAEGYDIAVIFGSVGCLENRTSVVVFESGHEDGPERLRWVVDLVDGVGFSCFYGFPSGLERVLRVKELVNVYCVHRLRVPGLYEAMKVMSV